MASFSSSQLETTFIIEFVDSSGKAVHSQDFSFTCDTLAIPTHSTVAKIMGEVSRILSTAEGEGVAVTSSRNVLRFSLENNQRPPLTVKFTSKLNGFPTNGAWDLVVGNIMDTVSRLVSDLQNQTPQQPSGPQLSVKSPPSAPKSSQKSFSSPSPQPSSSQRHSSGPMNSTLKSPIPCSLPHFTDLKRFVRSHPQCIVYVPLKNRVELMPAVITSYPANNDENMITCKLGLWRGATEITCRLNEIVVMKEIPQFAKMNGYSNPPASLPDYGIGQESHIAEFLGIVEITLPGKSCERLKIRYVASSDTESHEDEVPLFRCTLFREGSILDLLKKRGGVDAKVKSTMQAEVREQKFSETMEEGEGRRTGSRASKRGISDAIEVAEDADAILPDRRKSLRFSTPADLENPKRRSAVAVASSHPMEYDQEKTSDIEEEPPTQGDAESDELPLKENNLLHLSMSPPGASSETFPQGTSQTVPRNGLSGDSKKRRNSMGNLQPSPAGFARQGDKRKSAAPLQLGRGRRGLRHSPEREEEKEPAVLSPGELFRGEVFMVLNAGEKSQSPADDESQSVDAIERKLRQCGGQVVELFSYNGQDFSNMTVICKQEMVSFKYLYAIAAGIPCVSYDWVNACLDANGLVDKSTFLLPAGKDETGNVLHQRAPYTHIFTRTKIFVAARCKEFYVTWNALLQVAGATVLPSSNANTTIRRYFSHESGLEGETVDEEATNSEAESTIPTCEYVLVEPETECGPTQTVISTAVASNVPLVTCKWLIRCFLTGRLVNPSDDTKVFTWWGSLKQAVTC